MPAPARAALALLAGASLLIGCVASQPEREGQSSDHAPSDVAATAAAIAAAPRAMPPPPIVPRPRPLAAGSAAVLRSPRSAADLAGLTGGELRAVMGDPDLVRAEGEVQAWLYRSTSCLLDVFLEGADEPRVVLADARAAGLDRLPEEVCLRALARPRARLD